MAPAVVERLVGWATGVVGRLAEWFVGHLGRAVRWVGRQARTFVEPLLEPLRLLYAFIAARIGTWILALVLMVVYCAVAAAVAVVLYLFLYHNFVPIIAFHKPVYFDFTRAEPWAVADFADKWSPSGRPQGVDHLRAGGSGGGPTVVATPVLSPGHLYDFALDLQLPESPINDRIGMFMVTLSLYSWNGDLLANSSRPTDLLQKMWTVFWSVPLVLGLMEEKQAFRLELLSNYIDTHAAPFGYATVALSHRELEVYSAELHIEARLSGISYFCYYWFFTAMAVFVPLIFLAETWLIILTWLVIYFLLPAVAPSTVPLPAPSAPLPAPRAAPVSPAERRRRIAGIGRANEAAAATVAAAAAPLAVLEELGHEARSPALPRQGDGDDDRRRAQEDDDDDVALQELLEREIARKLKAVEEEEEEEDDGDDDEEEEEDEDTGAGVFPRLRRRRPRRAAVAAAQLEGATLTPPTSDAEGDSDAGDDDERTSAAAAATTPTTLAQAAEADTEDKTKLD
ncbi:adipose-regulatory protein (Seipin) protein [Acanthamoeba castellanii str. Neff]|uniref:Adipose-regulatory protein (Seipin) protein n=1 Tax=Acanthamoeba castellanii (strain ATCC 30010 / Neff) TaxID=1257118 RepID=L8GDV8_ACACF|nr:adipose-regulatory protein (Seipin) protein [Acanthamoeba castellanii str. Neff]ELR11034.1 adipose-regulatory protein (Seipin) protein [Acanthamoeba castellanii str. Neff]